MSVCETCWTEASRIALTLGGYTAEYYHQELENHPEHSSQSTEPATPGIETTEPKAKEAPRG